MRNIIVVAHKYNPQPDDDLVLYLNNNKYSNVLHIYHSFSDYSNRKSFCKWYQKGRLFEAQESADFIGWPEPIIYLKELFFSVKWILQTKLVWNTYIGMDGLCTNFGLFIKTISKVKSVVYWAIDFVPEKRFKQGINDTIYHLVNINGYKHADEMWDLSPRMAEARKKYLGINESVYKKRNIIPYGVWVDSIKRYTYENCQKNTLVFMGHLLEKQGVQLVLQAVPLIVSQNPKFTFKIIGGGQYEETIKQTIKRLGIEKYCIFMGKIADSRVMEEEIAKSAVAIAPYIKSLDTWTYYADPGKVKTYLACGVPTLLTDLPWNAQEIAKYKCGIIIDETPESIAKWVRYLMHDSNNQRFRENASKYSQGFNYKNIFENLNL